MKRFAKWSGALLALALAVGILVDDATVEIENIHRHMREGKGPFQAAIDASEEIGLSVIAATSRNPAALRCDMSSMMPMRLQTRTSSLPASVSPGPISGSELWRNGTPVPKALASVTLPAR